MLDHQIYHFVSAFVDSCIGIAALSPLSPPLLVAALSVLSCVAQPAALRIVPVSPCRDTIPRFDDSLVPPPVFLSRPRS